MEIARKLKAIWYFIVQHRQYKHFFMYAMTCQSLKLPEPIIYDIDNICEKMNMIVENIDKLPYNVQKMNFKNVVYDREDIKYYQRIVDSFRNNNDKKLSIEETCIQFMIMAKMNMAQWIWYVLKT